MHCVHGQGYYTVSADFCQWESKKLKKIKTFFGSFLTEHPTKNPSGANLNTYIVKIISSRDEELRNNCQPTSYASV